MSLATTRRFNPFPGLRPFSIEEDYLFFGREEQITELLALLRRHRFIAVVGTSGSGKSSLVRAGLLPALHGGTMAQAGSSWEVLLLRPGGNPIANLARAILDAELYDPDDKESLPRVLATLHRSRLGLIEAVRQSDLPPETNLLVVVDQFEELFRFRDSGVAGQEGAVAFVKLLLAASSQAEQRLYVAITMRSDYLGECSQIPGLAEAVNDGEYLIPRLSREQRRSAIEKPVAVGGAAIAHRLVQKLLNDVGDDADQLPVLQHALMRIWDFWSEEHADDEPLDLRHYERAGGLHEALSRHADEVYAEWPTDRLRLVAEKLFKALTERGPDNRGIRRPTRLDHLGAIVDATAEEVVAVIDTFRRQGRTFLMPMADVELTPQTVIDISHESLMRVWKRLDRWVEEESQSARIYRRLADTAALYREGKAGLYHDPDLQIALSWYETTHPTEAWGMRYHPGFEQAMVFLEQSRLTQRAEEQEREAARRRELEQARKLAEAERLRAEEQRRSAHRLRWLVGGLALVAAVAGIAFIVAWGARKEAQRNAALAEQNAGEAQANAQKAIEEKDRADEARRAADDARVLTRRSLYLSHINMAQRLRETPGGIGRLQDLLAEWRPRPDETTDDLRGWEWYYLSSPPETAGQIIRSNTGAVFGVAWSPDGRKLAFGTEQNTIVLWDLVAGRELLTLTGHGDIPFEVAWSPEGKRLASAGVDSTARIWDPVSGLELHTLRGHSGPVLSVAWNPDGRKLATSSVDGTACIWDAATGKRLRQLVGPSNRMQRDCSWSPDGKLLATSGVDQTMKIWDVESGREVQSLKGHTAGVPGVAWHPDGKRLASGDLSGTVRIWDVATGKELLDSLRGHASTVLALAWNLDGTRLATASFDNSARIWDPATGRELATLIGHTGRLTSIAWRPDGKQLATGGGDGTARIWSAAEEKAKALLAAHRRSATAMAWSPDGRRVASGGDDGTIVVRDTATGKLLELKGPATPVNSLAWSRQGKLASAGNDFTVRLWDPDTGAPLAVLPGHEANVSCVAWSPDGTRLASAVGVSLFQRRQIIARPVYIWDISDPNKPTLAHTLRGHEGEVNCVAWSPDGRRIASAGFDGRLAAQRIRIWDATTGKPVGGLPGPLEEIHGLAWSPDGQHIASAGSWGATFDRAVEGSIRIHHLTPGRPPRVLRGHTDAVRSVAWSPDPEGMRLLSAGDDRTLKVWNSRTGEELLTLTGHAGAVNAAAWSPDGMRIASAGADGSVRLWDATLGHEHELSPGLLKVLDDRIAAGNATARDYRLRGELRARLGRWEDAAADFAAAAEGQPESAPDSFMTPWWIVGPYPAELRTIHPPEKDPDPLRPAAAAAGSGSLRWQLAVPGEDNGVDLGRYFSGAEHISCYVYARIWSPRRQEVFILAGSDDTLRLWLNGGEPIHEHPNPRVAVPDQDVVPAALEPGWNTLLAKVVNETGAHGLFLRLSSSPVELARAWERKNQWDRALEQWDRAVKQEPDNPWLLVQRSRAARNAKRLDRARADTSALLQKYPDNVALLRSRAELYQAEQRWPDAIADATAAAKLRPEDWELQLELGRLHARAPEKVPAVLDHPAALIGRGLVLQETGRAKEAEADFVRAFQRLKDTPQAGEQFAQVFTNLADAAIRKGDLASAIMLLGRIVQARPNDVPLLEKRAHLYARRGQWKEAAEDFSRVIELDPSEHWHWYRLAPLLVETGQLERYRRHCREMRERFGNADAMTSGRAIQASLFLADAADDWKALADQARQNARDTNLPVRVSAAGMFAHRAGRFAEAIDTINASLASLNNPLKCRALCFLAMAYQAQNQPDEARGALDQVERLLPRRFLDLSANPLDASWIDWLSARILHREAAGVVRGPAHRLAVEADQLVDAKDLSGALERLTKAIALKADDPDLYYKRGDLYARRRQWKEAAADFAKRIELKPDESLMWLRRAPLLVMSGDADGYRRHCRAMLERFGETRDPRQADQTAKSCLLLPDAVADPRLPIALAERAVADESTRWAEPYFQAVRGLAAYRAGRFDDAIRRLEENQQAISGQLYLRELNQALLAMAYHRTNQPEKARKALDEAAGGIDRVLGPAGDKNDLGRGWNDLLNAAIIRREAEALLKKGDASHY